jgi:hypothetical protein
MSESTIRRRRAGLWCLLSLSLFVPACNGAGGDNAPWLRRPAFDGSNVVLRPIYELPEGRPFFVSGYAGAYYGPIGGGRSLPAGPTSLSPPPHPDVTVDHGSWSQE